MTALTRLTSRARLAIVMAALASLLALPALADGARRHTVIHSASPANEPADNGVFLFNRPGYYYMGRLFRGQSFDQTATSKYRTGGYRSRSGFLYRWGYAVGDTGSCLWIGPEAGGPGNEYLGPSHRRSPPDRCSRSASRSVVGSTEWLKNRNNIGRSTSFNCPEGQARGPKIVSLRDEADLYYNVQWSRTYSGGKRAGPPRRLGRDTPVQYRFTTKDGKLAAVFARGHGWGFVLASKVNRSRGGWSFAGDFSEEGKKRCQRNPK